MNRKPIVAANWKLNGDLNYLQQVTEYFQKHTFESISIIINVPSPYLSATQSSKNIQFGAQNISVHSEGAYTGEVSAKILADLTVPYVILGHSERRSLFAETNQDLAIKLRHALTAKLTTIYCIGETEKQRENQQTEQVLAEQLQVLVDNLPPQQLSKIIIAYEPIWAIGTGKTATPDMAQESHQFIRKVLKQHFGDSANKIQILYGGSVKAENAKQLFTQPDIDGGLVGGASLNLNEFIGICEAAASVA